MVSFLSKKLIKNFDDYQNAKVRSHYGVLCSVLSIVLNLIMAGFKIALGFITNSAAVLADGFNNLSDVASNVASLVGFVLALKNPDKEHPFGHGRMEYLASMLIALLILFVGLQTFWHAVLHIIHPVVTEFSQITVFVLIISIMMKVWMGRFNTVVGKMIESTTLIAAGRDSINDVLATITTLIAVIAANFTTLPVDGLLGAVVAIIILKTGFNIFKETLASLLGKAPDEDLLTKLRRFVATYDRVIGTHDLMIHDYGPGRRYLTIHVEVDKNEEMMAIHEIIDQIERDIYTNFKIKATIHLDPVDLHDELTRKMKLVVSNVLWAINPNYSIHDFRVSRSGDTATLIFDVQIPADDTTPHHDLMALIDGKINEADVQYKTLIQIDHSYT
jgi:cation diffusion facilitator family transporter